jgi:hypothetical protein
MILHTCNKTTRNGLRSLWLLIILVFTLTSCDNWIYLGYAVKNKSGKEVKLIVPTYCNGGWSSANRRDSIWIIQPEEEVMLHGIRILYPSRKGFYRNDPGVCGIRKVDKDTLMDLGCTKKEWKYRKGQSILILK